MVEESMMLSSQDYCGHLGGEQVFRGGIYVSRCDTPLSPVPSLKVYIR